MQRDWHDEIDPAAGQARILQRFRQPAAELVAEMDLPVVFEIVNHFADDGEVAVVDGEAGVGGKATEDQRKQGLHDARTQGRSAWRGARCEYQRWFVAAHASRG